MILYCLQFHCRIGENKIGYEYVLLYSLRDTSKTCTPQLKHKTNDYQNFHHICWVLVCFFVSLVGFFFNISITEVMQVTNLI